MRVREKEHPEEPNQQAAEFVPRVVSLIVSPGMVDTGLWRHYPEWYQAVTFPFRKLYLRSPEEAAQGVVHCLVEPSMEHRHGGFLYDGVPIEPSATGKDPKLARELWEASEKLVQKARLHNQLGLWGEGAAR